MFREMRRSRQQLTREEAEAVLSRGTSGVLSVLGDEGYPYGVPLSYVYHDGKLYFHWARSGHKLDAVRACHKASFCVVDQDQVVSREYTTYFRSAIAFGTVRIVEDPKEQQNALLLLARRYAPEQSQTDHQREIDRFFSNLCIAELTIQHLTGKEAIELVRAKASAAP